MDESGFTIDTGSLLAMNTGPTETTPALPDRHSMPREPRTQVRRVAGRVPWLVVVVLAGVATAVVWYLRSGGSASLDPGGDTRSLHTRFEADRDRAFALLQQGKAAEAIPVFERALASIDDPGTRINFANALKSVDRTADASREYQHVLRSEPRNADAWYNYGNLLYQAMHDPRGAVEAWRKATECDPKMGEAHFALGVALMEAGDYDTAVVSIQAALQVGDRHASWRTDADNALDLARLRAAEKRGALPPPLK